MYLKSTEIITNGSRREQDLICLECGVNENTT